MEIIEILKVIVLGIVQGITEWLPVSSTGHLILFDAFLQLQQSELFVNTFFVVIQFGSILAVIFLYFQKLNPFSRSKDLVARHETIELWKKVIVAVIPAAILGLLFDDLIDELFYHPIPVAVALIVVGVIFIIVETVRGKKRPTTTSIDAITYKEAVIIGLFQLAAAVFPGTSRSGATIVGALMIGVSRATAAEFTFFLAVPVMFGASLLKAAKYILAGIAMTGGEALILLVGTVVAFIVSVFVIKFLMGYIKKHDFKIFGWYRIILGILVILILR